MESTACSKAATTNSVSDSVDSHVDPFLVEALQNPRHRLTILRMELDIQKFLRNSDQLEFEFQHFPTSYLRLAAHRVAQHYGLITLVQEKFLDGQGTTIVVKKIAERIHPRVCLSEVPIKQSENDSTGQKKIIIQSRPTNASSNDNSELRKQNSIKSVEERKEEYDRARARIFSASSSPESEVTVSPKYQKNVCSTGIGNEGSRNSVMDMERLTNRDGGNSSRVAIFRDREKDIIDPDYDRSYERYIRNLPNSQNLGLTQFHMHNFQPPYLQYDTVLPQLGHMPNTQASPSYCYSSLVPSPYGASSPYQSSMDAVYVQVPSTAMMYTQSYDHLRHAIFQAPIYQQPLNFDYSNY
ncbi:R3H domain-containing protein 2 [Heracleum sosnowskyi]|uniref:R3H domain-containing protein 2 n=1 Tax=Heracleum sosnowskyi TaxID=360622 RepID=A0AAD8MWS6_9APIA|nr:R3H domain-containing protein 2 [Heracleum sosnowskyi]